MLIGGATFEESGKQGVALVLDLTERKRTEQALRDSEAKFRDFAETASTGSAKWVRIANSRC